MSEAKILIVEDEAIEALDLQQRLLRLGYPMPDFVHTGEEAVGKARETRPDLILMDIMLSGRMDGIQAAGQIRGFLDVPIIFLTAYADDETLRRARITEPYAYIVKPFQEKELNIAIDMALYKHAAERKLKESQMWLSTTLKSIGDAVIATDKKGLVTFMNPVAEQLTGWTQKDALQKKLTEVFHIVNQDTRLPVENPVTKVLLEGNVVGLANHTLLIARDGSEVAIDDSAAPIKDSEGNILGIILVFRDITEQRRVEAERRKAEDTLKLERRRLISILDTMEDGVCIINREYSIDYANPALQSQYGKLNGKKCYQYFVNSEEPCTTCYKGKLLGGEVVRKDVRSRRLDRIYEVTQTPLIAADGSESKLSIFHDITERTRVEKIKDEFIGMVSHELKTPLTVIIGALMTANSEGITPEEAKELTLDATDSALSLAAMVDNLLELSRYQSNKLRLNFEPTRIEQVVTAVVNSYRAKSEIHRLSLVIPANLPAISCDPTRVERILNNLIENAVKYSPYGGDIRVFADRQDDHIVIGVSDDGIGISPENQGRLFQSFERIDAYKENSIAGIGLGLRVCRILVEALGGKIWVESEIDKGSTFYFTLPLKS